MRKHISRSTKRQRRKDREEAARIRANARFLLNQYAVSGVKPVGTEGNLSDKWNVPFPEVGPTIVDSGAACHLIAERLVKMFPDYIRKMSQVIELATASGPSRAENEIQYGIAQLPEPIVAIILPDTPTVLSLGMLVIDLGWHFEWPSRSLSPFAIMPDGEIIWFVV